jgi:hypothetical protein
MPLLAALDAAEPKLDQRADRDEKKNYAQRLSSRLAVVVANAPAWADADAEVYLA